jgi:hypothetical protein
VFNKTEAKMPLFHLGQVVATPAALAFMRKHNINPADLLARHVGGDFGDIDASDAAANEEAIKHDMRVFSSYVFEKEKIWVITEASRESTCILLPADY